VVAAIPLLILTGCRVAEILTLRWQEVDFEHTCLNLSDSKTGRKTVYLNTAAIQILAGIDRSDDSPYVIPGARQDSHLVSLTRPWFKIRHRAGLHNVRLHDIRHTYASYGAGMGLSLPIIGKLLGHTQPITTQRYAHLAADPMREAAQRIGATLEAAMAGAPKAQGIPLPTAG
jgi:integrase